jgi:hypothetical protein
MRTTVYHYNDLLVYWEEAKVKGLLRLKGKGYVIKEERISHTSGSVCSARLRVLSPSSPQSCSHHRPVEGPRSARLGTQLGATDFWTHKSL